MSMEINADLVANVWKIVVAEGDTVADGDEVMILESMKMEIPVIAETGGVVREIKVAEGSVVQEGEVLVVLD